MILSKFTRAFKPVLTISLAGLFGLLSRSLDQMDKPRDIQIGQLLAALSLGSKPLLPDVATQRYINRQDAYSGQPAETPVQRLDKLATADRGATAQVATHAITSTVPTPTQAVKGSTRISTPINMVDIGPAILAPMRSIAINTISTAAARQTVALSSDSLITSGATPALSGANQ